MASDAWSGPSARTKVGSSLVYEGRKSKKNRRRGKIEVISRDTGETRTKEVELKKIRAKGLKPCIGKVARGVRQEGGKEKPVTTESSLHD